MDEQEARARELALVAHRGQTDKAGNDYFEAHVADVAHRVGPDPVLRTIAYLHDVIEDTSWTLEALESAGFSREVIEAVDLLTYRDGEPRDDYYRRIKANSLALQVKLADIASNTDPDRVARLDDATRQRLAAKYEKARAAWA